jgi:hypothetical protein
MNTDLESNISRRFYELVGQGELLLQQFPEDHAIHFQQRAACAAWMLSAVNVLEVANAVVTAAADRCSRS